MVYIEEYSLRKKGCAGFVDEKRGKIQSGAKSIFNTKSLTILRVHLIEYKKMKKKLNSVKKKFWIKIKFKNVNLMSC